MKSSLRWSWAAGTQADAPPHLLRAIASAFGGHDCSYRLAVSRHKGVTGPTVHVVSLGSVSLVAWSGPGSPDGVMRLPKKLEAAQRAVEAGLFIAKSSGSSSTSRKAKASVCLGTVGTIRVGAPQLPAPAK